MNKINDYGSSSANQIKSNILIVGTSLNNNLNQQVIKHVTESNVKFSTAFTVDRDSDARYPDKNFLKVVPGELASDTYNVLIMNSGPNEITNLSARINPFDNLDYCKELVYKSSEKMVKLAIDSLQKNPNLERVLIVKRLPRFDNKIKDPRKQVKGQNVVKIIREFLKIRCPMSKASTTLNSFFKRNKINLTVGQNYFPITKDKVTKLDINFSSSFGRHLEYYTGMVFKITINSNSRKIQVNGGRYDNLISDLGSSKKIPAVGGAISLND